MKVGLPSFCGLAVRRGEPLVIDYEDDDETFLERVQAVSAGLGVAPPTLRGSSPAAC
jgi:RecA-family ATPase